MVLQRSNPVWRFAMVDDEELRVKLPKVEALFRRTGSPRERAAAGAAMDRPHARLGDLDRDREPDVELKLSLPDMWSARLFIAICRKRSIYLHRYARQRRTTVMVRADEGISDSTFQETEIA